MAFVRFVAIITFGKKLMPYVLLESFVLCPLSFVHKKRLNLRDEEDNYATYLSTFPANALGAKYLCA